VARHVRPLAKLVVIYRMHLDIRVHLLSRRHSRSPAVTTDVTTDDSSLPSLLQPLCNAHRTDVLGISSSTIREGFWGTERSVDPSLTMVQYACTCSVLGVSKVGCLGNGAKAR
jgi:hypothetical protein